MAQKPKSTTQVIEGSLKAKRSTTPSKNRDALKGVPALRPPRKETALARLGVDESDLEFVPNITDSLTAILGGREGCVPRKATVGFLSASNTPVARAFLECYREIPAEDRESLSIEAICVKASVSPLELLGAVLMAAKSMKAQESALKAILAHPEVIETTIQSAKNEKTGFNDRKLLHEAIGFLPTKHGASIAINLNGPREESEEETDDEKAFDEAFPLISNKLEKWGEMRRKLTDGR